MHINVQVKTVYLGAAFVEVTAWDGEVFVDGMYKVEVEPGASSRALLRCLIKLLKNVGEGTISHIKYQSLDKKGGYVSSLPFNIRRWQKNDFKDKDGNILKNAKLIGLLCKELDRLAVPMKKGDPQPIKIIVNDNKVEQARYNQIVNHLNAKGVEIIEAQAACVEGNPLRMQEKVQAGAFTA